MSPVLPADDRHAEWMQLALDQAGRAAQHGEVPVGAVVVRVNGGDATVVAARHNECETASDPTAHAEVLALRDAASTLGDWRLEECVLVVTLEPCPMCAGAAWASRIGGVVFGAESPEAGSLGSLYHLGQDPRLNHEFAVRSGVLDTECAELLAAFFRDRRVVP